MGAMVVPRKRTITGNNNPLRRRRSIGVGRHVRYGESILVLVLGWREPVLFDCAGRSKTQVRLSRITDNIDRSPWVDGQKNERVTADDFQGDPGDNRLHFRHLAEVVRRAGGIGKCSRNTESQPQQPEHDESGESAHRHSVTVRTISPDG